MSWPTNCLFGGWRSESSGCPGSRTKRRNLTNGIFHKFDPARSVSVVLEEVKWGAVFKVVNIF